MSEERKTKLIFRLPDSGFYVSVDVPEPELVSMPLNNLEFPPNIRRSMDLAYSHDEWVRRVMPIAEIALRNLAGSAIQKAMEAAQ